MASIEYQAYITLGYVDGQADPETSEVVYGSYAAVKHVQTLILDNERLRKIARFNGLSSAELERLALLAEELGEAVQSVGKIMRHGYTSHHPYGYKPGTNREQLEMELGDVKAAIDMMSAAEDIDLGAIAIHSANKRQRVTQFLHHQPTENKDGESN